MTQYIDPLGRRWNFQPGHPTEHMVQVPWALMAGAADAERMTEDWTYPRPTTYIAEWSQYKVKPDCYILADRGLNRHVYTGARYGDEGHEYISSILRYQHSIDFILNIMRNQGMELEQIRKLFSDLKPMRTSW